MTTTTYRNDVTGYRVTLTDNGKGARVTDSLGYDFPMNGSDYPFAGLLASSRAKLNGAVEVPQMATSQMASPLTAATQVPASNLRVGSSLTTVSDPLARAIVGARAALGGRREGVRLHRSAVTTLPMLQALVRRGHATWVERFRTVEITGAGHVAADKWLDAQVAEWTR